MNRTVVLAVALAATLVACRGGDDTSTGDDVDAPPGGAVHIQDIQNDSMAAGTQVSLKGVVVTAIDTYGMKTGDFWVEEPDGGEFSGVHVFGAELPDVAALTVGDIVSIDGAEKDEFTYQGSNGMGGDTSGRSITELKPVNGGVMKVTKTGMGTVPAPHMVDALAIGMKATQAEKDAEWEKWEGVLITVTNVTATNAPKCVGSACSDNTNNNFTVTGGLVVESSLAAFPGFMAGPPVVVTSIAKNDCLAGVTGVVDYFFDYLLLNTSTAGVMTGGSGCAVLESTHATCSDGLDNDGNGFKDCADFSCQMADPACSVAASVASIQMGTTTGPVSLANVYVTARDDIGTSKGLWVADSLTAAQYNGVFVFTGSAAIDPTLVVGATVNVSGTVQEFPTTGTGNKVTEVSSATVTLVPGTPGATVPLAATAAQVGDITNGEPYEGVLVTLSNLKITNNNAGQGKMTLVDNAGTTITTDDESFQPGGTAPVVGTCYSSYTGVMHVQTTDNVRTLNARSAADTVVGTTCN